MPPNVFSKHILLKDMTVPAKQFVLGGNTGKYISIMTTLEEIGMIIDISMMDMAMLMYLVLVE